MVSLQQDNRAAWLAERRKGVGGSDVAAILGLDPYKTPYQVWRDKLGLDADEDAGDAARRGKFLEDAVLARYAEDLKPVSMDLQVPHENGWRRGNQDARATLADGLRRCVEVKTVNRHVHRLEWGAPWTDEVPDRALCQGLWYADLDDAAIVDFAVLVIPDDPDRVLGRTAEEVVAISDFFVYQAERNRGVEQAIVKRCHDFWHNNVLGEIAPEPSNIDDIDLRWPNHQDGNFRTVDAEDLELIAEYERLGEIERGAKKKRERVREQLLLKAQDAEGFASPEGSPLLTCKTVERAAHSVKASRSRTLRTTKWWTRLNQSPDQ